MDTETAYERFVQSVKEYNLDVEIGYICYDGYGCDLFHNRIDKFNERELGIIGTYLKTHLLDRGIHNISFDYEEGMFETDSVFISDQDRIEKAVRELKNDTELNLKIEYKCLPNSYWNPYTHYAWETHTYYILHNRKDNEFTQDETEKINTWILNTFDDYKMYNYVFDYDEKVDRGVT